MTTNQTIDGVPRELLERCARELSIGIGPAPKNRAQELRDLLDGPFCKMCGDSGWVPEPFSIRGNTLECPECTPAAQPQGEPVGSFEKHMQYMHENIALKRRIAELEAALVLGEPICYQARHSAEEPWFFCDKPGYWEWRPLYTTNSKLVMPERRDYAKQYMSDDEILECDVWNACLDEVTRMNTK